MSFNETFNNRATRRFRLVMLLLLFWRTNNGLKKIFLALEKKNYCTIDTLENRSIKLNVALRVKDEVKFIKIISQ